MTTFYLTLHTVGSNAQFCGSNRDERPPVYFTCYLLPASHTMSLQEQFDKAAGDVKKLKSLPSDNDLLELYGLFKQATVGDADPASKPGMLDFKGKAKFEAWVKRSGTSKEDAQKAYIAKVETLIASIGLQ